MNYIDEAEIRKAIALMKPNNELFEIRIFGEAQNKVLSGYFTDVDKMIEQLRRQDLRNKNVYITLNQPYEACYSRKQKDFFLLNPKTTADTDIEGLEWLMIDLDPKRPAGTSSSESELNLAKDLGNKIFGYMRDLGFEKPLMALSGNGVHLLYRVNLANEPDRVTLLQNSLKALNLLFSTDKIGVDLKNFNPSRICKLYGTLAQKGVVTEERQHRMARVIGSPDEIKATDVKYLQKLCEKIQKEPDRPQRYNNYSPKEFDLDDWLDKYGIGYRKQSVTDATKYILDCCPFDSNHKGKDAVIFKSSNGAIGFHCFHNSCEGKTWRDVRVLYEPDAYEKQWQQEEPRKFKDYNRNPKPEPIVKKDGVPIFYNAMDILNLPQETETFIRTGIKELDKRERGLAKKCVSVWSGLRGSAKSTLLSEIMLNAREGGYNTGCFSGELNAKRFMKWMNLQAAGKNHIEPTQYEGYFNVSRENMKKIAEWLGDHLWLYNNDYGRTYESMEQHLINEIDSKKLDLIVIDNLMALDITSLSSDKYEAQKELMWKFKKIADEKNIHLAFVAHPRKAVQFLRLDDISGTGDISNIVDYAFIVHRINRDFIRLTKEMFRWCDEEPIYRASNCIEITKDRDGGAIDTFIPLYYEQGTKRLKNEETENKEYGWCIEKKQDDGFEQEDDSPFK